MKLSALRTALEDVLRTIDGLNVQPTQGGATVPPCARVVVAGVQFDDTMGRGMDTVQCQVVVDVSRADDVEGLSMLDEYVQGHGDRSIKAVLETATGTGLSFVRVRSTEVGTRSTSDGAEFMSATFAVEAVVSGS